MLIRLPLILTCLLAGADATFAQTTRTDVRPHPPSAVAILSSHPDEHRAVYSADGELLFESGSTVQRANLNGTLARLKASTLGSYAAALVMNPSDDAIDLRVFAADGTQQWNLKLAHGEDDRLPRPAVSDANGSVAYVLPSTAEVCFAAAGAAAARCSALFKDAAFAVEREVLIDYSADGRHVVVAAQREPAGANLSQRESNTHIFLFDRHGGLLWSRTLSEPSVRSVAFSPTSAIAVSTYDAYGLPQVKHATRLFSLDGVQFAEVPFGADTFLFPDGEVLLQSMRALTSVRIDDGGYRVLFRPHDGMQIIAADAEEHGNSAAAAPGTAVLTGRSVYTDAGFAYTSLRLLHLDDSGAPIEVSDLDLPPQQSPRVHLDNGATVLLLDDAVRFYTR